MQLVQRDLIELDDPIVKYVPELWGVHNPFGSMEAITIRQLMSHSAGFRGPTWPWGGDEPDIQGIMDRVRVYALEQLFPPFRKDDAATTEAGVDSRSAKPASR